MRKVKRVSMIWFVIPLIILAIYTAVTFVRQQEQIDDIKRATREMQMRIDKEETARLNLTDRLEGINSDESMEQLAREKLGMVKDGERVFVDTNQ